VQAPVDDPTKAVATQKIDAQAPIPYALDEQNIYWVALGSFEPVSLRRVAIGSQQKGLALFTRPESSSVLLGQMAVNSTSVLIGGDDAVYRISKTDGASDLDDVVATATVPDKAVTVVGADDLHVYWLDPRTGDLNDGHRLRRTSLDASKKTDTLAEQAYGRMGLDATHAYAIVPDGGGSAIQVFERSTLQSRTLPAVQPGSSIADVYLTEDTIWWLAIEGSTPVVYRVAK
jgi:hypothetical protein